MHAFDFKKLTATNYRDDAYLLVLAAPTPTKGVVLLRMNVVIGWPNPVLTTLQGLQEPPHLFLVSVHNFLQGPFNKNLFNMAIYEVKNKAHATAIFGPLTPNLLINDSFASMFHQIDTQLVLK